MRVLIGGMNVSGRYQPSELDAIEIMQTAYDGQLAQGSLPQPDPSLTNEWYTGQAVEIDADNAGALVLLQGFVGEGNRARGDTNAFRRVDTITLWDDNALLYGFYAHTWVRPAETDQARVLAFAAAFLPGTVDTSYVLGTHTATLAAKTYDTDTLFTELLQDVKDATGKTIYMEGRRLHSHLITEGQTPAFAISDVSWDYTGTWPPAPGATRTKDPSSLVNAVLAKSSQGSGTATASDAGSITTYDAGGLKHQKIITFDVPVAGLSAAAAAYVASNKDEILTYTMTVGPFTAAQTALVIPGGLISVTCAEVGLSAATQRIASVKWHYKVSPLGTPWWADLEIGFPLGTGTKPRIVPPTLVPTSGPIPPATINDDVTGACGFALSDANRIAPEPDQPGAFELVSIGTGYLLADSSGLGSNGCDVGQTRWYGGPESVCRYYTITTTCKPGTALVLRWSGTVTDGATDGVSNDFGYFVYWCTTVPMSFDQGQLLGMFHAGAPVVIDIPASWTSASASAYLLFSPVSRVVDGPFCLGNSSTPVKAAAGHAYGYFLPLGADVTLTWDALDPGQSATANWVPVVEAADGSRVTFTLAGWDATGTPEVLVNGLAYNLASMDTGAGTVTLTSAPPDGALVVARYPVAT